MRILWSSLNSPLLLCFFLFFFLSKNVLQAEAENVEDEKFWEAKRQKIISTLQSDTARLEQIRHSGQPLPGLESIQPPPPAELARPSAQERQPLAKGHQILKRETIQRQRGFPCPVGYTGDDCNIPLCAEKKKLLPHELIAEDGELIELVTNPSCHGPIRVYIDSHISKIRLITIGAKGSYPDGVLYTEDGVPLLPIVNHPIGGYERRSEYRQLPGPGLYTYVQKADTNEPCTTEIAAWTELLLDGGWVASPHDDDVQEYENSHHGVERNPRFGVPSYYAFKPFGLEFPGAAKYVSLHKGGLDPFVNRVDVKVRFNCSAAFYVGPYEACQDDQEYYLKVLGIDDTGAKWQRVYRYFCDGAGPGPQPGPGPGPPPTECLNGGTLIKDPKKPESAFCYCGEHFTGKQCETKLCMNNGQVDKDSGKCRCRDPRYGGDYCEHVKCRRPSGQHFDTTNRALTFVVRVSKSMRDHVDQLWKTAKRIVADFEERKPGYFQSFVLVEVGKELSTTEHSSSQYFINDLKNLYLDLEDNEGCDDRLLAGVSDALKSMGIQQYPKSPVFVFSDVLPSEQDVRNMEMDLLGQLSHSRSQLFFILVKNQNCVQDFHSHQFRQLRRLAQFSHGLVSHVNSTEDIGPLAFVLLSQALGGLNELLANDWLDSCANAPKKQPFFVDPSTKELLLFSTAGHDSSALRPTIRGPDGRIVAPASTHSIGNTQLFSFEPTSAGNYLLEISLSPGAENHPCQYRLMAESDRDLFFAVSEDQFTDANGRQPVFGEDAHIVARVNHVEYPDPENIFAELIVWTNELEEHSAHRRTVLYTSTGTYRDQCDFNLYFGSWNCPRRNMIFYMNVYVNDGSGFITMRTTTGLCSHKSLPPVPSDGCQNGGVKLDGKCLCTGGWTGDKCQTIVCQSGGKSRGAFCECAEDRTGQFCEMFKCQQQNPNPDRYLFQENGRELVLLVHQSLATRPMLRGLAERAQQTLHDMAAIHADWITSYSVATFNSQGFQLFPPTDKPDNVTQWLKIISDDAAKSKDSSCSELAIVEALIQVLKDPERNAQRAIVFVFAAGKHRGDPSALAELTHLVEQSQTQIHFVQTYPCGDDYNDTLAGMPLALSSGGNFFPLTQSAKAAMPLLSIPTLYSAGLLFEGIEEQCQKTTTFYFPVDSHTQSFSLNVLGDLVREIQITAPDKTDILPIQLWQSRSGVNSFYQVIRGCDDDWTQLGSRCFFFAKEEQALGWADAKKMCHQSARSSLASIFNAETNKFLKEELTRGETVWIGLNDLASAKGQWQWDQPEGADPLTLMGFADWASGQPDLGAGKCVQLAKDGWRVVNCEQKRKFVCVRHAYDADFQPKRIGENPLLPGIWSVKLKVWDDGVEQPSCGVRIFAQSGIQVFDRFSVRQNSDFGSGQPSKQGKTFIIAHSTFATASNFGQNKGHLQYGHLTSTDTFKLEQVLNFNDRDRDTCSFDSLSDQLLCDKDAYQMMYTGVDNQGFGFQRIRPIVCYDQNKERSCENGGVYSDLLRNCECPSNFAGMRCEYPICKHGIPRGFGCRCDRFWVGRHCDIPYCKPNRDEPNPDLKTALNKTLIVVLDGSWTSDKNAKFLANLDNVLDKVITFALKQDKGWISNFVGIVAYDSHRPRGPLSQMFESRDKSKFIAQLKAEVNRQPQYRSRISGRAINKALRTVVASPSVKYLSNAFVLLDANAEDYEYQAETMDALAAKHVSVSFYLLDDTRPPGGIPYTSPPSRNLFELSFTSGGNFFQVPDFSTLTRFWKIQLGFLFYSYQTGIALSRECSELEEFLQIDMENSQLTIEIFSTHPDTNITLINGKGQPVRLDWTFNVQTKTNTIAFLLSGVQPGIWRVKLTQPTSGRQPAGFCYLNIRLDSANFVRAAFNQDTGLDRGAWSDTFSIFARPNVEQSLVTTLDKGQLTHIQVYDRLETNLLWASPLIRRRNCQYEWTSQHLFTCSAGSSFTVALVGFDQGGYPFRRVQHGHCQALNAELEAQGIKGIDILAIG